MYIGQIIELNQDKNILFNSMKGGSVIKVISSSTDTESIFPSYIMRLNETSSKMSGGSGVNILCDDESKIGDIWGGELDNYTYEIIKIV